MRSFTITAALALTLFDTLSSARVADHQQLPEKRDTSETPRNGLLGQIMHLFNRDAADLEPRQAAAQQCVQDDTYSMFDNSGGLAFCSGFISVPPNVVTVDYTPTVYV